MQRKWRQFVLSNQQWGPYHKEYGCYGPKSNGRSARSVYADVGMRLIGFVPLFLFAAGLGVGLDDYVSARQKLDQIETGRLRPGARLTLSPRELDAYVAKEAPAGVRNPRLELQSGAAKGVALIDFGKVRRAQGHPPGWLMSKLLDGERPVTVVARIQSGNGRATVDVQRVEISGIEIDGRTLDFLIQNVLLPIYPDAAVGRPFELGHRIERLDVQPGAVGVVIGR
jgi:hypothetical protein